uniref:Uncharacterized protein n=1 Tax=Oryza glumipatula TaxID=40148 RepID=A0A0E0A278_9ORYZ
MIDCFVQNSDFMPWRRNVLRGHLLRESETRRRRQTPASRQSGSGGEVPYTKFSQEVFGDAILKPSSPQY